MRRFLVFIAIATACLLCILGAVFGPGSTQHRAKVGSPNFVCIATLNLGICIGPPTQHG